MDGDLEYERTLRAARNQSMFRFVNEKIQVLNETFEETLGTFAIACECGNLTCIEMIELPAEVYERVRGNPRTFLVVPDHVALEMEQVLDASDGYVIVETTGLAAGIAETTDPRSADWQRSAANGG